MALRIVYGDIGAIGRSRERARHCAGSVNCSSLKRIVSSGRIFIFLNLGYYPACGKGE
jgi:hypothetical protein